MTKLRGPYVKKQTYKQRRTAWYNCRREKGRATWEGRNNHGKLRGKNRFWRVGKPMKGGGRFGIHASG